MPTGVTDGPVHMPAAHVQAARKAARGPHSTAQSASHKSNVTDSSSRGKSKPPRPPSHPACVPPGKHHTPWHAVGIPRYGTQYNTTASLIAPKLAERDGPRVAADSQNRERKGRVGIGSVHAWALPHAWQVVPPRYRYDMEGWHCM